MPSASHRSPTAILACWTFSDSRPTPLGARGSMFRSRTAIFRAQKKLLKPRASDRSWLEAAIERASKRRSHFSTRHADIDRMFMLEETPCNRECSNESLAALEQTNLSPGFGHESSRLQLIDPPFHHGAGGV